jgi:hypothetical protein
MRISFQIPVPPTGSGNRESASSVLILSFLLPNVNNNVAPPAVYRNRNGFRGLLFASRAFLRYNDFS